MLQFCEHDKLQYCWMRYLPRKGNILKKGFWGELVTRIEEKINSTPVVRSLERRDLRPIDKLRYILDMLNDRYGNPLFADLPNELYLSDNYSYEDLVLLADFGMQPPFMHEVVWLVEQDLKLANEGKLRMKSEDSDDSWHSRAAIILQLSFEMRCQKSISKMKQLGSYPVTRRALGRRHCWTCLLPYCG